MARRPCHLSTRHGIACGLAEAEFTSTDPTRVTCKNCQGTLAMADAEVLHQQLPRRERNRSGH